MKHSLRRVLVLIIHEHAEFAQIILKIATIAVCRDKQPYPGLSLVGLSRRDRRLSRGNLWLSLFFGIGAFSLSGFCWFLGSVFLFFRLFKGQTIRPKLFHPLINIFDGLVMHPVF